MLWRKSSADVPELFSKLELKPGERLDELLIGNLKIIQHEQEFSFSLDALLLAHFVTLKKNAKVVDLGAGTGVIGLLLAARGAREVFGVEINAHLADMAKRSIALNNLEGKIHFINGDLRQIKNLLPPGTWDTVVSNPPYRSLGGGKINPNKNVAAARHELDATLVDVIEAARFLVKYRGRFAMVHLPQRLAEVIEGMRQAQIEPKRLQMVYPKIDRSPKMFLIEGVRGAKCGLNILPPLIVYNFDGSYSNDILKLYKKGT